MQTSNRSKKSGRLRIRGGLTAALVLIILALTLTACASYEDTGITSVTVEERRSEYEITVKAELASSFTANYKGRIYLFALSAADVSKGIPDLNGLSPIAETKDRRGEITFKLALEGDIDTVRGNLLLSSAFILACDGENGMSPISSEIYLSNPEALAQNAPADGKEKVEPSQNGEIKGLSLESADGILTLKSLGVRNTVAELDLEALLCSSDSPNAREYTYTDPSLEGTDNASIFVSGYLMESLDSQLLALRDLGINTYLRIALPSSELSPSSTEGTSKLFGALSALAEICLEGNDSVSLLIGDDLCRISDGGLPFGTNEEEYVMGCAQFTRLAYVTARLHNATTQVYISLGKEWESSDGGNISSRRFINLFDTFTEGGGDFPWGVALRAAIDVGNGQSVLEAASQAELSKEVSLTDLSSTVTELSTPALMYEASTPRSIIIDSARLSSDNLKEEGKDLAALYSLAYMNGLRCGVGAIILDTDEPVKMSDVAGSPLLTALETVDQIGAFLGGALDYVNNYLSVSFGSLLTQYSATALNSSSVIGKAIFLDNENYVNAVTAVKSFKNGNLEDVQVLGDNRAPTACGRDDHMPVSGDGDSKPLSALCPLTASAAYGIKVSDLDPRRFSGREAVALCFEADLEGLESCRVVLMLCQGDLTYTASTVAESGYYGSLCFDLRSLGNGGSDTLRFDKKEGIDAYIFILSPDGTPLSTEQTDVYLHGIYSVDITKKDDGSVAFTLTVCILVLLILALVVEIIRSTVKNRKRKKR